MIDVDQAHDHDLGDDGDDQAEGAGGGGRPGARALIDVDRVAAFLDAIWGDGPHALCSKRPGGGFQFEHVYKAADVMDRLVDLRDADAWIGAHPLRAVPAQGRGGRDDVAEVRALHADLDWAHETRCSGQPYPTEAEVRARLRRLGPDLQPSVVVHSGHGLQVWWVLDSPATPDEGDRLMARLDATLTRVDLINGRSDLASIMRLPGTFNHKGDGTPVPVVIDAINPRWRFQPEYLRKYLDAATAGPRSPGAATRHQPGAVTEGQQALLDHVVDRYGGHDPQVMPNGSITLTRPGKAAKDGASASIIVGDRGDAVLTVFSANWPTIGPRSSWSSRPWVLGYDGELCAPDELVMSGARRRPSALVVDPVTGEIHPNVARNLPDEFWERPVLAAIRAYAHGRGRSADAVYGAVRARLGALVPYTLTIDTGIATPASLNSLVALIGNSGSGKSTSAALAADLVTLDQRKDIYEGPLGSGEGVAELYFEWQDQPNPVGRRKPVKERVKTRTGALLLLDEGEVLTQMAERSGSTILPTLRSAYSGAMIGQTNAKQETRRVLAAGSYRFVLLVGLQAIAAAELLADQAGGTPQRFVLFNANDPTIPADAANAPPPWSSGPWIPPTITSGQTMTLADEVRTEIRGHDLAVQRGDLVPDPLDAHRVQNRIKEAGMLAILDERVDINAEDWRLAGMVLDTSDAVRGYAIGHKKKTGDKAEDDRTKGLVRRQAALATDAHERAVLGGAKAMARLAARAAPAPSTRRALTQAASGRDRHEATVDEMIAWAEKWDWLRPVGDAGWVVGGSVPS